jgi:hypothetical protein
MKFYFGRTSKLKVALIITTSSLLLGFNNAADTQTLPILTQTPSLLVHVKQAQKDLKNAINAGQEIAGKRLYDQRLERIKKYYRDGEYQTDLKNICTEAEDYFKNNKPDNDNALIIFDIDDTAITSYTKTDSFCFLWDSKEQCNDTRKKLTSTPIQPVLNLYNAVKKLGYKIAFLSSLRTIEMEKTKNRLADAGYKDYDELILKNTLDLTSTTAAWKRGERKKLAERYLIAGCVGDRPQDFEGGYTGYKVKLPNYLY